MNPRLSRLPYLAIALLAGACLALVALTFLQASAARAYQLEGVETSSPTADLSSALPAPELPFETPTPPGDEGPGDGLNLPPGMTLIEGDILVPLEEYERYTQLGPSAVYTVQGSLWPDGIVPYVFDSGVTAANRTAMIDAMAEWENVANVDFKARAGEANYVYIQNSTGNWSSVGMQGGRQDIGIFNWGWRFIMAHELGHTLGFWHEQSRPSRDTYVAIVTECVQPGTGHNFVKTSNYAGEYGPYDFESVMHYSLTAFLRTPTPGSGCTQTIRMKTPDPTIEPTVGQRAAFSQWDKTTMSFLYPEDNWVFVDMFYYGSQYGTFWYPYNSFLYGVQFCPAGGKVIIQPGYYYSVGGTYATPMTWTAPLGNVLLFP